MIEPKFKKGDYVINRFCGDIAIIKGYTKNIYYTFDAYYSGMLHKFKNVKDKNQIMMFHYQTAFDLCNEDERKELDKLIKEKGGK